MGADEQKLLPPILKMPWTFLDSTEAEVHHIIVNQMELYTISHAGNLLFTPQGISVAHLRFINYPTVEKTWHVWILSESDIKGVAARFGLDIEGLELDLIVHHFKKRFMPMVDSWDYVLKEAIEQAKIEKAIHL